MRVLIVKTTSMGDVVHALPAASDLVERFPEVELDWLVEAPFAAIPGMHTGVNRVMTLAWRKWRGKLFERSTREAISSLRRELRRQPYDFVIDLQGLVKSAIWARQAGAPVGGYGIRTAREPLASLFYRRRVEVGWDLQAVERCRRLVAGLLRYPVPESAPDFSLQAPEPGWMPSVPYAVLIPGASRVEKLWPERRWAAVGQRLRDVGLLPVVLWGSDAEQTLAERIAASCDGDVPPFLKVGEAAALLAGAQQVVGLDTGFAHLAAAFGRPTLGIYCDHDPGECGITGSGPVASIGGRGQVPGQPEVMALLERQLAQASAQSG